MEQRGVLTWYGAGPMRTTNGGQNSVHDDDGKCVLGPGRARTPVACQKYQSRFKRLDMRDDIWKMQQSDGVNSQARQSGTEGLPTGDKRRLVITKQSNKTQKKEERDDGEQRAGRDAERTKHRTSRHRPSTRLVTGFCLEIQTVVFPGTELAQSGNGAEKATGRYGSLLECRV